MSIIEKLQGDGRNEDNSLNSDVTDFRRMRERWWMDELQTRYPYGLNIRAGSDLCNQENNDLKSYNNFHPSVKRGKRKRGKRRPKQLRKQQASVEKVLSDLKCLFCYEVDIRSVYKQARVLLLTLPKKSKKEILLKIKPSCPSPDD